MHSFSLRTAAFLLVISGWLVYTYLMFTAPVSSGSEALGLTGTTLFAVRLTFALPYLLMWLTAAYGWSHISSYSARISDSADGKAFGTIAQGLGWLLIGLVLSALVSAWRSMGIDDPLHLLSATIVTNYLYVFMPLIGFIFIYQGARQLKALLKSDASPSKGKIVIAMAIIGVFSAAVTWLTFTNEHRQTMPAPDAAATYYLSDPFIALSITLPLIFSWVIGGLAILAVKQYQKSVRGNIYRDFLKKFSYGIFAIVLSSIILQGILALGTDRLVGIGLGPLLIVIYVFLALQAAGYLFVALSAKKLARLEEATG